MISILGIYPMSGSGGIASWTKNFLRTFPDDEYRIFPVDCSPSKDFTLYHNNLDRSYHGTKAMLRCIREARKTMEGHPEISVMHITTSAGMGTIRDYFLAKMCHKRNVKCVMHCRFGTVKEKYESKDIWARFFVKNIDIYDQTWVLDSRSAAFLRAIPEVSEKIFLTPNSIVVPDTCNLAPKAYSNIGFVGNIVPSKGIFELVQAVVDSPEDVNLTIAGSGSEKVISRIKTVAGDLYGSKVKYLGKLANDKAVELIESLDIIALPTYYPGEAFPISIIEAMSRGKLVISCPRAAIPDMLTASDGSMCGILVTAKSEAAIAEAIHWIENHKPECDAMCAKAYAKVRTSYRTDVVYRIYKDNFSKLHA